MKRSGERWRRSAKRLKRGGSLKRGIRRPRSSDLSGSTISVRPKWTNCVNRISGRLL